MKRNVILIADFVLKSQFVLSFGIISLGRLVRILEAKSKYWNFTRFLCCMIVCSGKEWGLSMKCNRLEVKRISLEENHVPWGQRFWKAFHFLPLALVFVNPPANPCPLKSVYRGRLHLCYRWQAGREILPFKVLVCVLFIATKPEFRLCCFWKTKSNSKELRFFISHTSFLHRQCWWSDGG